MCTAFKMHVNSEFQVSPGMKVTWCSGWGERHTWGVFKLCVLQHPNYAYISGFELPLCHYSESKFFQIALGFRKN